VQITARQIIAKFRHEFGR